MRRKLQFKGGGACPEQYDVFLDGKQVGYVRLRHGDMTVECPDCGGNLVYEASPRGDGDFYDEAERDYYLRFAGAAILKWVEFGPSPPPPAPDIDYEVGQKD